MKNKLWFKGIAAWGAMALAFTAAMPFQQARAQYSESEWKVRPWEIIKGLKPRAKTLWQLDVNGLESISCSGADSELAETDVTKLWGEKVAKLSFSKAGSATVKFLEPAEVAEKCDGIELWVYGPAGKGVGALPLTYFLINDANGRSFKIQGYGGGSRWAGLRWWGVTIAAIPEEAVFPIRVDSVSFTKLTKKDGGDHLCFDMLGAWNFTGKLDNPDVSKMELPFPNTPDTIMPTSMGANAANSVEKVGDAWRFSYSGDDASVLYEYTPASGTLGDITVQFRDNKKFQIAKAGGPHALIDGEKIRPDTEGLEAELLECSENAGRLTAKWRLAYAGKSFEITYVLSIKGKTLVVEASSDAQGIQAFDAGYADGLASKPQLFGMTYMNNRWDYPRMMATNECLVSVFADWYNSHGSYYVEGAPWGSLQEVKVLSDSSARILGGTVYSTLTNGKYVPLYEKLFFTVSDKVEEILPNIPNPKSPYRDEMIKTVCVHRMYSLQGRDNDVDCELAFWKAMKAYGAENMFVRYHSGQYRIPLENNRFSLSLYGAMSNGGDETMVRLLTGLRKLVKWVGVYQDNRVICASDPYFNYDIVSRTSNGGFVEGWDGCFRPRPATMLGIYRDFVPKFLAKFPWNAEYLDELDNAPPWADVDFDWRQPGAGTFSHVLRAFGAVALDQRRLFNGPIWSEGCSAYLWAGLLDVDYGVSNDTNLKLPIMVDYKLRKINPLSCYTGADWPVLSSTDPDYFIATEIAQGNIGYLANGGPEAEGLPSFGRAANLKLPFYDNILKSYFMMRQLQEIYLSTTIDRVCYFVDGKLMDTSEMLMAGKTSQNRIYLKYANGLEIWVNRAEQGDWEVNAGGEDFTIPPNGHVAIQPDVLVQYTAIKNGGRVDYSQGPIYTYVNAHGVQYEFPELSARHAYMLREHGDGMQLVPVPFLGAEQVKGLDASSAEPLDQDGKAIGEAMRLDKTDAGLADLNVDGSAFSYILK